MRTQFISLTILFGLLCSSASAQWVRVNVPYGGSVACFGVRGSTLLAGTNVGLMRSTDNGETWERTSLRGTAWAGFGVAGFAVNGTKVFVGVNVWSDTSSAGGVLCSTDDGISWTPVNNGLPDYPVAALAVGPAHDGGTNLYVGGSYGIYRSTNDGESWEAAKTGLADTTVRSLVVIPDASGGPRVFAGTYEGGIFVSTDDGTTWTSANSGLPPTANVRAFASLPDGTGGTNLFVGANGWYGGIFRSTDFGESWTAVNNGFPDDGNGNRPWVMCFGVSGTNLLVGTSPGGVFRSTDFGASWTPSMSGLTDNFVYAFAVMTDSAAGMTLFAGTWGVGVFRSTDDGLTWTVANRRLMGTRVLCTAVDGTTVFAGTDAIGVFRSTDFGTTWEVANTGMQNAEVRSLVVSGSNLVAYAYGRVFRSTNGGTNWEYGNLDGCCVSALGAHGKIFFAGIRSIGVYISTDYGATWANAGLTNETVTAFGFGDSCIFAATSPYNPWGNSGIYRSTDDGKAWTFASTFPANRPIEDLGWCRTSDGSSTYLFASTSGGIFRSTDEGSSWAVANTGLTETYASAFAVGGGHLFVGTFGAGGVFCSSDYGAHWSTANTGLSTPYPHVLTFAVITDRGGATTILAPVQNDDGAGMWRASLADLVTSSTNPDSNMPSDFTLEQNYPNPFNPTTSIKYQIPNSSHVTLKVFNTLGQEVATLVDEAQDPGYKSVLFDGAPLSSGVYFYRLQAGDFVQTRELVILK